MPPQLTDGFGRTIDYLRVSVTDRCDLRCFYCMPKGFSGYEDQAHWLDFDELVRVVGVFAGLGVSRVRITGGEPLVRRGLADLAARLGRVSGVHDLSLSTNAVNLARHAQGLHEAGINRINVSLDTLRPERFHSICGGNLERVMAGLMAARATGFHPIKINTVALRGINDDEFIDMVRFCLEHDFTLRFIETMPVGATGQGAGSHFLDLKQVREQLAREFELVPAVMSGAGPARYVRIAGTDLRIGFITPLSQHFCETCNRVRLSADGTLHLCLGQENSVPLLPLLRGGATDGELEQVVRDAMRQKPERHEFNERPGQVVRMMSQTGG